MWFQKQLKAEVLQLSTGMKDWAVHYFSSEL